MASSTECVSGYVVEQLKILRNIENIFFSPGNDESTAQSKHDTTDTEQKFGMYMKDFDFLEYELESLEGESVDNFNWGVRRPSISNLEAGENSAGLDARQDLHKPVGAEESSDDELESVSPVDDMSARSTEEHSGASSSVSTTSSGVYPPSNLQLEAGRRSSTPHSETESGDCSEGEMSDLTPCNASPSLSQLLSWSSCRRVERDDVEENWRSHVQTLMTSSSQDNLLHTFALFARLFRDLRGKTVGLTEDSCTFLSRDESAFSVQLNGAVTQFKTLLGVLAGVPDCPHVWCDFNLLGDPRLTERIKFNVLEIQENFENYVDKKDTTLACLEGLKAHVKLVSLGENVETCSNLDGNLDGNQVELCRFLYKLHFQQLLLLESYTKLLQLLSVAALNSGVFDLSGEVAAVRSSLLTALADTLTPPSSPANLPPGSPARVSTPSATADSPTPRASPPLPASTETEPVEVETLFVPSSSESPVTVLVPGISLTPPLRSESESPTEQSRESRDTEPEPEQEQDISVIEQEEVFVAEMSPDPAPPPSQPTSGSEPVPETRSEAVILLISHLTNQRWKEVWEVWRGCRNLWESVYTLGCSEGSLQWSQAQQDTEDLTHILNIYCRHLADTRDGQSAQ